MEYDVLGFIEKNRDHLSHDLTAAISSSHDRMVVAIADTTGHSQASVARKQQQTAIRQFKVGDSSKQESKCEIFVLIW